MEKTQEKSLEAKKGEKTSSHLDNNPSVGFPKTNQVNQGKQQALVEKPEKLWIQDKESLKIEVSSFGMGVKFFQLKNYVDKQKKQVSFGSHPARYPSDFSIALGGPSEKTEIPYFRFLEPEFGLYESSNNTVKGVSILNGIKITREITLSEKENVLISKTHLESQNGQSLPTVYFSLTEKEGEITKQSLFNPNFQYQNAVIKHSGKIKRVSLTKIENQNFQQVDYGAFESQYFAKILFNKGDLYPNVKIFHENKYAQMQLLYTPEKIKTSFTILNSMYIGPKYVDMLEKADKRISSIVNYGFFDSLAKPMLFLLKWFYSFIKNWGMAIIFLTLFVRILLMPLNIFSHKSMQSMQAIQPLIKEMREKHKGDSQRTNQEMMTLMKQHKVNPLGGCLPILFQFPVFIALYQVLGRSIELYQAPFFGWIQDLSLKDPFYVLPILMGASMFVQQKITPTTMDPTQTKIFMIIPVLFTFLMLNLPSGLTLYIFVSTLFGIIQQFFLMRKTKTT